MWEEVLPDHPRVACADHVGRFDELLFAERDDERSHDTRWVEPTEEAEQDRQRDHSRLEDAVERDGFETLSGGLPERDHEQEQRKRPEKLSDTGSQRSDNT